MFGIPADRITDGHRFLAKGSISIRDANSYDTQLREEGKVEPDQQARRVMIADELARASQANGGLLAVNDEEQQQMVALLDEVTSLVEWPAVYTGQFDPAFLEVPQECLILSMRTNQRYFPLFDADNKLQNRFLIVSNMAISDPSAIIDGNERVVRPRLADARFFFDQDRQQTLASRLPQLAQVVYHARLGSQAERSERIQRLAAALAPLTGTQPAEAERAAALAKTDLLTGMVGEFPELQGIMGRYYARHDGEPAAVAEAIAEHYQPRFAGDALPTTPTGLTLALADKLETLAGIWGIGQRPTGDKDPFALRRHALGVVRILIEGGVQTSLTDLLSTAFSVFDKLSADKAAAGLGTPAVQTVDGAPSTGDGAQAAETQATDARSATDAKGKAAKKGGKAKAADTPFTPDVPGLTHFVADRLRSYLREQGYGTADIEAVLAVGLDRLDQLGARLSALAAFRQLPAFEALTAANKRIGNILRKSATEAPPPSTPANAGSGAAQQAPAAAIDPALLTEAAEQQLHQTLVTLQPQIEAHLEARDFTAALQALAALQAPVDAFFDQVMVNADDPAIRRNRLALLAALHDLMNRVADLAQL
ncbi:MAG: glycine--tRNA ligase subunit beta [Lautropia sp.]|nr:glycine--tRNA ligase subunit beta [Lautropia sp.]